MAQLAAAPSALPLASAGERTPANVLERDSAHDTANVGRVYLSPSVHEPGLESPGQCPCRCIDSSLHESLTGCAVARVDYAPFGATRGRPAVERRLQCRPGPHERTRIGRVRSSATSAIGGRPLVPPSSPSFTWRCLLDPASEALPVLAFARGGGLRFRSGRELPEKRRAS